MTRTFTFKIETMNDEIKTVKASGKDLDDAIDNLCRAMKVGNILEARDGYRNRVL